MKCTVFQRIPLNFHRELAHVEEFADRKKYERKATFRLFVLNVRNAITKNGSGNSGFDEGSKNLKVNESQYDALTGRSPHCQFSGERVVLSAFLPCSRMHF